MRKILPFPKKCTKHKFIVIFRAKYSEFNLFFYTFNLQIYFYAFYFHIYRDLQEAWPISH